MLAAAAAIAGSLGAIHEAAAPAYPARPIPVPVPFSAGNVIALVARGLGGGVAEATGGSVRVVNREGASGIIRMSALASSRPDGYPLGFAPQGRLTIQPPLKADLPYTAESITPICQTFE